MAVHAEWCPVVEGVFPGTVEAVLTEAPRCKKNEGPAITQRCFLNAGHKGDCMCVRIDPINLKPPVRVRLNALRNERLVRRGR